MSDDLVVYQNQLDYAARRAELASANFQLASSLVSNAVSVFSDLQITNRQIDLEFKRIDSALEAYIVDAKTRMMRYENGAQTIKAQIDMLSKGIEKLMDKAFSCPDFDRQMMMMEQLNKLTEKLTVLTAQLL